MEQKKFSWFFIGLILTFSLCFILDNFLEMKPISLFGIPATVGLLVIPISYIVGDTVTEVYGIGAVRRMLAATFLAYAFFVGLLYAACVIPAAEGWDGEEHFSYIFSMSPGIMFYSILAFICGNMTNAWIMAHMKKRYARYGFKARAIVSTIFGEGVDSVVFFAPVFWGVLPPMEVAKMCITAVIMKTIYEACILPITCRVVRLARRAEGMAQE